MKKEEHRTLNPELRTGKQSNGALRQVRFGVYLVIRGFWDRLKPGLHTRRWGTIPAITGLGGGLQMGDFGPKRSVFGTSAQAQMFAFVRVCPHLFTTQTAGGECLLMSIEKRPVFQDIPGYYRIILRRGAGN